MNQMIAPLCLASLLTIFAITGRGQGSDADAEGKKTFEKVCAGCHELTLATSRRASREEWQATVEAMQAKGADATDDQVKLIVDYLAKNYGPAGGEGQNTQPKH